MAAEYRISYWQEQYPGKSNTEIAEILAKDGGHIAVIQFESQGTFLAGCTTVEDINSTLNSPFCENKEVVYHVDALKDTFLSLQAQGILRYGLPQQEQEVDQQTTREFSPEPTKSETQQECLSCHGKVNALQNTCPHCGGTMFMQAGSGQDALSWLDTMEKQKAAAQHVDRGAQLILQGRYIEAEKELESAIKVNPMNATAHSNMGAIFHRQERFEDAIPWLEKALELNPHLEGVPEALTQVRAALEENQATKGSWFGLAMLIVIGLIIFSVLAWLAW